MSLVFDVDPPNFTMGIFRIYLEEAASMSDVRLDESGDLYVRFDDLLIPPVDNLPDSRAADRGIEDPLFQELLSRRLRGRHVCGKRCSLVRRSAR